MPNVFSANEEPNLNSLHLHFIRSLPPNATPAQIQETAKVISGNRFQEDFATWFLADNQRGSCDRNLQDLANRAAEFLLDLFVSVRQNLGQSEKIPKGHRRYQVYTLTFLMSLNYM